MSSSIEEYNTTVQTDRISKIYGTLGTISYQLDPHQINEKSKCLTQRKTHNDNTNFDVSLNNNIKQYYNNNYKTGNANNKTPGKIIMIQQNKMLSELHWQF